MRTIRLPAVPQRRLAFGSSEWAADSCLAEWSEFEREWLPPARPARAQRDRLSPLDAALAGVAFGALAIACWSLIGTFLLH
jgi:hypothetical protein